MKKKLYTEINGLFRCVHIHISIIFDASSVWVMAFFGFVIDDLHELTVLKKKQSINKTGQNTFSIFNMKIFEYFSKSNILQVFQIF